MGINSEAAISAPNPRYSMYFLGSKFLGNESGPLSLAAFTGFFGFFRAAVGFCIRPHSA